MIINPILPGFHPDPSVCRVGDDYYIATSTFQWYPGVRFHHSKDLIHWEPKGYALTRLSQLDMLGNDDNSGVWAPCLSFADGLFHLIYSDVKTWNGPYRDVHNYLVTAPRIEGPWSEPIYMNSSGFDPSLFHDEDGRKWFVNVEWDHRVGRNPFGGILLQEYLPREERLAGPIKNIFKGTTLGLVEAPHLYRKDGWYYLLTAEGGTFKEHASTLARCRSLDGPYEVMPHNPLITADGDDSLILQRAGHGALVETQNKKWYLVHLCGRPVRPEWRCILGRETALQALEWKEGEWPALVGGGNRPSLKVPSPGFEAHPFTVDAKTVDYFDTFGEATLSPDLNTLRRPPDSSWLTLEERPGFLRLYGRESLQSKHRHSLVARRLITLDMAASTVLEFEPETFKQMAGLTFFYHGTANHYLYVSADDRGRFVGIHTCQGDKAADYPEARIGIPSEGRVHLKGELHTRILQFFYSLDNTTWIPVGPALDATILADESGIGSFTGTMVGLCAHDLTGRRCKVDFDWFQIQALTEGRQGY